MRLPPLPADWVAASYDALCPGRHVLLGTTEIVAEIQTAYQRLVIAEVPTLGRGLFLDGTVQLLALGEQVYHERLALLPVLAHPQPRAVLVLGGGDGCAAREALRDPRVERVTIVEIDPQVIDACATHLHELNRGSLRDPRVEIHAVDARNFLAHASLAAYSVAIVDFLDAYSAPELALYRVVLDALAGGLPQDAIVSLHGDLSTPRYWPALRLHALAAGIFPQLALHSAFVNCYNSEWGFLLAGRGAPFADLLSAEHIRARAARLQQPPQTIVPELFPAALQLAPALAALAAEVARDPWPLPADQHEALGWLRAD
jgi:spermidine synthase